MKDPLAVSHFGEIHTSHCLPREAGVFLLPPPKCFLPNVVTQLTKDLAANHFRKMISPTHKDWIKDLNQRKSTKILVFGDFLDLFF
jgi:hypothetical protein